MYIRTQRALAVGVSAAFDSFSQYSYEDRTMDYIVCPDCNNRIYPTRYCSNCGKRLIKGAW